MKALIYREIKSVFCSPASAFFALVFLLATGCLLWFFSGSYNIIDSGYADTKHFFALAAIILSVLIPALTMRTFAEERRNKTLDTLLIRPVSIASICLSKFLAVFIFVVITILPTMLYVYSLYQLANPTGNIDMAGITASYISLLLLTSVFIAIGMAGSAATRNQVAAFLLSLILCLFVFYGFDLLAELFISGKIKGFMSSLGLSYHYRQMQRGVIQVNDLVVITNYILLSGIAIHFALNKKRRKALTYGISCFLVFNLILMFIPNNRFDFTADKRFTLSQYSKDLLKGVAEGKPLKINIYLTGELNYGFQHLQDATRTLLDDFNSYANNKIAIDYVSPYQLGNTPQQVFDAMHEAGMTGIFLNETDREGKISRKVIYPYAQVINGSDTLVVPLLKNVKGYTAEQNLNASAESLEFEFTDAIRLLQQERPKTIAFIEGHDEIPRTYVYDAEEVLAKYYFVNRGEIGNRTGELDDFDAVIIAGPLKRYSETEKYILDQYIMQGGKVLWLVDGAYYSHQQLARTGQSPSMKNDTNLDDMLFTYGVRINADLIQDQQCITTYLVSGSETQSTIEVPNYYQPLLMPSPDRVITKNIRDVLAGFASSVDVVNKSADIKKDILLTTSANTRLVKVPETIDFDVERVQNTPDYFDHSFIPVAVSLQGRFASLYAGRIIPDSVETAGRKIIQKSTDTRMIVVSSSDIITNGIEGQGGNSTVLPMGYDRVSGQQYGNRDFIVNAVNWLTDDEGLMVLRTKKQQLYILDKKLSYESRDRYALINIVFPPLFVLLIMGGVVLYRKRKYGG
ncbi:gliding motility-associated ABC transporter substrate-binding protein GldG [Dysgonomonas sp. 511]|uniref:gliding motility-associated ABC transporter substrate-binding protein GldG n=1 Tax=Dysgonomonas sp. 511 TaxID=2302930 RepID=UPI0013D88EBB|nr:gliding motility-associated ABC transporter substrate-binding protein GldG [Dysgonomonas sp. 511]NDV79651.1 gliding motility-associated ABC transporter substrate-binding protein GldG [Dysgonomonas sp. 511]